RPAEGRKQRRQLRSGCDDDQDLHEKVDKWKSGKVSVEVFNLLLYFSPSLLFYFSISRLSVPQFLLEPTQERAEVGGRGAIFLWPHPVEYAAMRRPAVGYRAGFEVVLGGEQLEARRLTVDIDGVPEP